MSRIYFHSPSGTVEAHGPERHLAAGIVSNMFNGLLGISSFGDDPIMNLIPTTHHIRQAADAGRYSGHGGGTAFKRDLELSLAVAWSDEPLFVIEGRKVAIFDAQLNTAIVAGSRVMAFVARLHGQCECHGYVEGINRSWLADIIEEGVEAKILRLWPDRDDEESGWPTIIKFLRERHDEPVVTSFSVCEQFPNQGIAGWKDEHDGDDFYDLPREKQWELGMKGVRRIHGLEWKPETFTEQLFGVGDTAFTIREAANQTAYATR